MRAYVDTNVFLYAIGTEHGYREPCRELVRALGRGSLAGETSVETLQEISHHRRRRGDPAATERARAAAGLCRALHAVDAEIAFTALDLVDSHPELPSRDAVHAATALARGLRSVVTADADFDMVPGLERVDPLDRRAVARLLA
jgi:hypothetical protein